MKAGVASKKCTTRSTRVRPFAFSDLLKIFRELLSRDKLKEIIKSKDIHVRDLLTHDPKDLDFGFAAIGRNYEGRVVPKEFDLYIDGAVYGDQVAILSLKRAFAVIIESKEVADTFRSLFELAWKMSTPLEQFEKSRKD